MDFSLLQEACKKREIEWSGGEELNLQFKAIELAGGSWGAL